MCDAPEQAILFPQSLCYNHHVDEMVFIILKEVK